MKSYKEFLAEIAPDEKTRKMLKLKKRLSDNEKDYKEMKDFFVKLSSTNPSLKKQTEVGLELLDQRKADDEGYFDYMKKIDFREIESVPRPGPGFSGLAAYELSKINNYTPKNYYKYKVNNEKREKEFPKIEKFVENFVEENDKSSALEAVYKYHIEPLELKKYALLVTDPKFLVRLLELIDNLDFQEKEIMKYLKNHQNEPRCKNALKLFQNGKSPNRKQFASIVDMIKNKSDFDRKNKRGQKTDFGKQSNNSDFADNDNALTQHEKR